MPELVKYLQNELGQNIPVIAAGGIWARRDIDPALAFYLVFKIYFAEGLKALNRLNFSAFCCIL